KRSARGRTRRAPFAAKLGSCRAAGLSGDRHRVAGLRQRESSVKRTFHLLDELRDIVQRKSWFQITEIAGRYCESLLACCCSPAREPTAQRLVDDLAKGSTSPSRFGLQLCCNIVVARRTPQADTPSIGASTTQLTLGRFSVR